MSSNKTSPKQQPHSISVFVGVRGKDGSVTKARLKVDVEAKTVCIAIQDKTSATSPPPQYISFEKLEGLTPGIVDHQALLVLKVKKSPSITLVFAAASRASSVFESLKNAIRQSKSTNMLPTTGKAGERVKGGVAEKRKGKKKINTTCKLIYGGQTFDACVSVSHNPGVMVATRLSDGALLFEVKTKLIASIEPSPNTNDATITLCNSKAFGLHFTSTSYRDSFIGELGTAISPVLISTTNGCARSQSGVPKSGGFELTGYARIYAKRAESCAPAAPSPLSRKVVMGSQNNSPSSSFVDVVDENSHPDEGSNGEGGWGLDRGDNRKGTSDQDTGMVVDDDTDDGESGPISCLDVAGASDSSKAQISAPPNVPLTNSTIPMIPPLPFPFSFQPQPTNTQKQTSPSRLLSSLQDMKKRDETLKGRRSTDRRRLSDFEIESSGVRKDYDNGEEIPNRVSVISADSDHLADTGDVVVITTRGNLSTKSNERSNRNNEDSDGLAITLDDNPGKVRTLPPRPAGIQVQDVGVQTMESAVVQSRTHSNAAVQVFIPTPLPSQRGQSGSDEVARRMSQSLSEKHLSPVREEMGLAMSMPREMVEDSVGFANTFPNTTSLEEDMLYKSLPALPMFDLENILHEEDNTQQGQNINNLLDGVSSAIFFPTLPPPPQLKQSLTGTFDLYRGDLAQRVTVRQEGQSLVISDGAGMEVCTVPFAKITHVSTADVTKTLALKAVVGPCVVVYCGRLLVLRADSPQTAAEFAESLAYTVALSGRAVR